ncbi:MAG TPA: glutamate racemase [Candidatus Dormibacteraeota bacterium]|jgi:glutamate racemase|nr:glutamate racemase [Candidatus Dormibacteraeota bacterium]
MSDVRPIGVFDSGVGGLTVLRELRRQLPGERLIYLADLVHFPYGPRYQDEVRGFAHRIIEHLQSYDVKLVVIACNTATAAALQSAREHFDVPIVGVIAPGAQAAVQHTRNGRVAVISTEGTFASQQYLHAIKEANPGVGVLTKAAPDLVDIVEHGDADTPRAEAALRAHLEEVFDWGADTLVLGCTHYPLLRPALARVVGKRLRVVDSAETTAARVQRIVKVNRLASGAADDAGAPLLLTTGEPDRFAGIASLFFGEPVPPPDVVDLWSAGNVLPVRRLA